MPGDDISIHRRWEGIELEPGTPGRKNVVITINDADRTEDRRATVQAVETLLIALMGRETKAQAAALRAEADKLDPQPASSDIMFHGEPYGLDDFRSRVQKAAGQDPHDTGASGQLHCGCCDCCGCDCDDDDA